MTEQEGTVVNQPEADNKPEQKGNTTPPAAPPKPEPTVETYTKEQLEAARVKALEDWKKTDEGKAFVKYQKDHQTDAQREADLIKKAEESAAKVAALELRESLRDQDCKKEFLDFVAFQITQTGTDVAKFKKEHPQYFGAVETTAPRVSTGGKVSSSGGIAVTTNQIMNEAIRKGRQ